MTLLTKYFVDPSGRYIGAFCGSSPDTQDALEVPCPPSDVAAVWDFDSDQWGDPPSTVLATRARRRRDVLLRACDVQALPDFPHVDDDAREAWMIYRQLLRDVPDQEGFPSDVTWPDPPQC